jgi:hypothetical protein
MKARFSLIAIAIVISWSGIAFAQQSSAPAAGPPRTCSQQVAVCTRFCDNASIHSQGRCRANCQRRQSDCITTGMWELPNGQKVPRQEQ